MIVLTLGEGLEATQKDTATSRGRWLASPLPRTLSTPTCFTQSTRFTMSLFRDEHQLL